MTPQEVLALYKKLGPGWRLYAAQGWQESRFKIDAVSPAACYGVAQFSLATWGDCIRLGFAPVGSLPTNARFAIPAQKSYMNLLLDQFHRDLFSALAAYNWGIGHV